MLANAAAQMRHLRLLRHGGIARLDGFLAADRASCLLAEARAACVGAVLSDVRQSDGEETRGGEPARRFHSAAGGTLQTALYHSAHTARLLARCVGTAVIPTGARGSFTYYAEAGDFLALHRDVPGCDVAVITCVHDSAPSSATGGILVVYPRRMREPLSAIRASTRQGGIGVRLAPGESVVMLGGLLPHAVTPIDQGQQRVISVLCYGFADALGATPL